jgi:hypothetical protein
MTSATTLCNSLPGRLSGAEEQVNEVAWTQGVQSRFVRVCRWLVAAASHVVHSALPNAACKRSKMCRQLVCKTAARWKPQSTI